MPTFAPNRRQALIALAAASLSASVLAQANYPNQTIRIVVPWPVGTPPDVVARIVANKLPELLKQPVIVDNKPGAAGTIGLAEVARAPADGYTVGALHFATTAVSSLYPSFKVDLVKDFTAVGQMEWSHNILVVSPELKINSVPDLISHLKKTPGQYASGGVGAPAHLSGLQIVRAAGVEASHVPYNNFGQAIADVTTGRVTFMVMAATAAVPQVKSGRLKALAVTGPARNPELPDVPTMVEVKLPTAQSRTWSGLVVRSNTPKEIVDRLSREIAKVIAMPDVREQIAKQQSEVPQESLDKFRDQIRRDSEFGATFVKANSITIE